MKYIEYGKHCLDTIILLHGGGLSWWNYEDVANAFQNDYHIILPILNGHAESDKAFTTIENNAKEIIEYIDAHCGGSVLMIGGLSLGGQILLEILSQRKDICQYAVVESTLVRPSKLTYYMIKPAFGSCYGLIKHKWFSALQFKSLKIKANLFEHYFRDTIADKTEMIISNFVENGRFQIDGKGKAMVVADSRANAVRYYFAIKEYMKKHLAECEGCGVLVAFSGTVPLDGVEYTEASLNVDEDGQPITSDKKFRKAFRSSKYNILVVANKYQTGFDEPLLHTMYVDKKLKSVNAVQTLSRLNRTCRGKTSTFVLDFVNTDEQIKESFQPFYTATFLEGRTDYNKLYGFRKKIQDFGLYNMKDVDDYYAFMSANKGAKQDPVALGKLSSLLKPIIERYNDLNSDEDRSSARMAIRNFVKSYAYITQLTRIHDEELFKEYVFANNLLPLLPVGKIVIENFLEKVQLEYTSLKESFTGAIVLDKKDTSLAPSGDKAAPKLPKKDTLSNIIEKVNERFSGDFTETDRVIIESIFQMFMNDKEMKKYKRYAKDSSPEMFVQSLFPDKFKEIATQCCMDNADSYKKLFTDTEFYQKVMEAMAKELYKALRKD